MHGSSGFEVAAGVLGLVAALLAFALATVVVRASPQNRINRRLALFLALEGLLMLLLPLSKYTHVNDTPIYAGIALFLALDCIAQLAFVSTLEAPLARATRSPIGRALTYGLAGGVVLYAALRVNDRVPILLGMDNPDALGWMLLALTALVSLAISIDAYARTPPATTAHRRAHWFTWAFGARNTLFAIGILTWGAADALDLIALRDASESIAIVGTIALVALLTYGVLSTQLFDIDLKLKWGIRRGTIASLLVGGFFAVYKVAEFYMGREVGWISGGVLSGVFFFLAPRLNKMADNVANKAMPQVQPTPEYLTYKKLEVYRSALESALENGRIDERDRALLDRMRVKLGLKKSDTDALEADVLGDAPAKPDTAASAPA